MSVADHYDGQPAGVCDCGRELEYRFVRGQWVVLHRVEEHTPTQTAA